MNAARGISERITSTHLNCFPVSGVGVSGYIPSQRSSVSAVDGCFRNFTGAVSFSATCANSHRYIDNSEEDNNNCEGGEDAIASDLCLNRTRDGGRDRDRDQSLWSDSREVRELDLRRDDRQQKARLAGEGQECHSGLREKGREKTAARFSSTSSNSGSSSGDESNFGERDLSDNAKQHNTGRQGSI